MPLQHTLAAGWWRYCVKLEWCCCPHTLPALLGPAAPAPAHPNPGEGEGVYMCPWRGATNLPAASVPLGKPGQLSFLCYFQPSMLASFLPSFHHSILLSLLSPFLWFLPFFTSLYPSLFMPLHPSAALRAQSSWSCGNSFGCHGLWCCWGWLVWGGLSSSHPGPVPPQRTVIQRTSG